MENTDKMQNKCLYLATNLGTGQNLHEGNLLTGRLRASSLEGCDGSLLASSGKSEGNASVIASPNGDFLVTVEEKGMHTPFVFHYLQHE